MSRPQHYPKANTTAQWYEDNFPGAAMNANVGVLHTTEGPSWPSYSGGAVAPNITGKPNFAKKRIDWRQHFPVDRSARALQNASGGVETNTLNAFQIELVGTCSRSTAKKWEAAGHDFILWPEAPEWALRDLADLMAWLEKEHGIPLQSGLRWVRYPDSYGNRSGQRMSGKKWRAFYGWCGHQHVPENVHGDPGDFPIERVLDLARGGSKPEPAHVDPAPIPTVQPSPIPNITPDPEEDSTMTLIVHPNGSAFHLTSRGLIWLPADVRKSITGPVTVVECDAATWDRYREVFPS